MMEGASFGLILSMNICLFSATAVASLAIAAVIVLPRGEVTLGRMLRLRNGGIGYVRRLIDFRLGAASEIIWHDRMKSICNTRNPH